MGTTKNVISELKRIEALLKGLIKSGFDTKEGELKGLVYTLSLHIAQQQRLSKK